VRRPDLLVVAPKASRMNTAGMRRFFTAAMMMVGAGLLVGDDARPPSVAIPASEEVQKPAGKNARLISSFIRPYEPNEIGYTSDQGNERFMDFTISLMIPLITRHIWDPSVPYFPRPYRHNDVSEIQRAVAARNGEAPPAAPRKSQDDGALFRPLRYRFDGMYFAVNERAGQYLGTRQSSPVVGKTFNPLVSFRFWGLYPTDTGRGNQTESEDNFLELVYAHESNGQYIDTPAAFSRQMDTYLIEGDSPKVAYDSTRDNISRGWDYIGPQFARDWNAQIFGQPIVMALRTSYSYYLSNSFPQGRLEQYNAWEDIPGGKPRRYFDGVRARLNLTRTDTIKKDFAFADRFSLIAETGYARVFRYDTIQGEFGFKLFSLPMMFWYRYGYNESQIDYFEKNHSFGLKFSFAKFQSD
jgi:hypothetical protein